jgi:DNA-binding XRE family transcriptional regulator
MDRLEFVGKCNEKLKLVRTEYEYSQDKMSLILGLSKKTIVEIEKRRSSLGWIGSVALCSIFPNSEILSGTFGGKQTDIIMALAFDGHEPNYPKTMGGKVWWNVIKARGSYKIQQNIISQHYRILDKDDRRVCSTFDYDDILERLDEVSK